MTRGARLVPLSVPHCEMDVFAIGTNMLVVELIATLSRPPPHIGII